MRNCDRCKRHIREDVCPFCGGRAEERSERVVRVGRVFVAVATGAMVGMHACSAYGAPIGPPAGPYLATDAGADADTK